MSTDPDAVERDVEFLLARFGLVVRRGRVIGRQIHDVRAERGDPETRAHELGEAVHRVGSSSMDFAE